MEKRSESFGRLLKAGTGSIAQIEGKTQQALEADLGELIGVAGVTLQRYKAGHLPPDAGIVELLAEACVQRGLMSQRWLERLLEAARHPAASSRALVGRLFPEPAPEQPRAAYLNLPPPTYSRFIMRGVAYTALMAGLQSTLPVTLVVSLGGMGKTSLARAATGACLEQSAGAPHFASAVWVSDKDRPGSTNLSTTLDEIARVLDYPGLLGLPFAERRREVELLVRRQPVLLVIDNAETITDRALLEWLASLPEPSKALVTSRFVLPELAQAYLVELEPMSRAETRMFIAEWLPRSKLRNLAGALDQLMPVADVAGGNPKALELALGLLQHRVSDEVIADLRAARHRLFDELFDRAWELLDSAAQRVILSMPLFPASACADALAYCADLSSAAFTRSAEQLTGLSLLDLEREELRVTPRYNAHSLVRAYAQARCAREVYVDPVRLRERWLHWCLETASAVGFCWDELDRLDNLDREYEAIQAAINWAAEHNHHQAVIVLVEGLRYYYNVRGIWGEAQLRNHELRAQAAQQLGAQDHEILSLAHLVEVFSKQCRLDEAASVMLRLNELGASYYQTYLAARTSDAPLPPLEPSQLRDDAVFEYGHAQGLYARACGDLEAAEQCWRELLAFSALLGGQKYVVNRRWLATVLLQQGAIEAARTLFVASLADAQRINDLRSVSGNRLKLALLDLERGQLSAASAELEACKVIATRYRDRRRLAEYHLLTARRMSLEGQPEAARPDLLVALDLFERLGMRKEAQETRLALV